MIEEEESVDVTILAERRAKLAKLRGEHFVQDRDITSAPSVTVVDEFRNNRAAVEWQVNRQTLNDLAKEKSDLEFNSLIKEANQRKMRESIHLKGEPKGFKIVEDTNISNREKVALPEEGIARNRDCNLRESFQVDIKDENQTESRTSDDKLMENGKSVKIYQDGSYLLSSSDDLGYQSSSSLSPDFSKRSDIQKKSLQKLLKIEKPADPLSLSLPESLLKSVKKDLSDSIKSTSSTRSKVIYDPRMFVTNSKVTPNKTVDPEKEYFKNMLKFHEEETMVDHKKVSCYPTNFIVAKKNENSFGLILILSN